MAINPPKERKGSVPSEDPDLINEIEKQNQELESVKSEGIDPWEVAGELRIDFVKDGRVQSAVIDPFLLPLSEAEVLLWVFISKTKGIINRKAVESLIVTNFRLLIIDELNKKMLGYTLISALEDVVVMNTQIISESMGYALYNEGYAQLAGPQFSSGASRIIGDIVFLVQGQKYGWPGIPDPEGLKNFILSIKKTMYDPIKELQTKRPIGEIKCSGCGQQNPVNSKFCNGCGVPLSKICSKCSNSNPLNSSYCNKCGFILE